MSNIDLIADKLCQEVNLVYDELDSETKLYIYAQAMLLNIKGVKIGLQVISPHQNPTDKPTQ